MALAGLLRFCPFFARVSPPPPNKTAKLCRLFSLFFVLPTHYNLGQNLVEVKVLHTFFANVLTCHVFFPTPPTGVPTYR